MRRLQEDNIPGILLLLHVEEWATEDVECLEDQDLEAEEVLWDLEAH